MFHALTELRKQLEAENLLLVCFGASETVYPSGMCLSMGDGNMAYKMELDRQGTLRDLVNILDTDNSVRPATIIQQRTFRDRWFQSRGLMTKDHVIKFYRTGDAYGYMSNFATYPIDLDGLTWPTSEHYFQAQKFTDPAYTEAIRLTVSPMEAAKMGRNRSYPLRADWETAKDDVMRKAVLAKFSQHAEIRAGLLATGESTLVEHTANDSYWADGGNGYGLNKLGLILMEVREILRRES